MFKFSFFLTGALFLCAANALALSERDLLFYLPLDGSLDAAEAKGIKVPVRQPSHPEFVEGHTGKGLLIGGPGSELSYATSGNLKLQEGTISMWVKPIDWSIDHYYRSFFQVGEGADAGHVGEGNFLWLYKCDYNSVYWLLQRDVPQRFVYIVAPRTGDGGNGRVPFEWEKGKWSHLAASWSGNQMNLFINGKYVGTAYVPFPVLLPKLADEFELGGVNRRNNGTADAVLDEVMILNRSISPEEAEQLFEKGRAALKPDETGVMHPLLEISAGYLPSNGRVELAASVVGGSVEASKPRELRYEIFRENKVVLSGHSSLEKLNQKIQTEAHDLTDGEYRVHAALVAISKINQETIAEADARFEKHPTAEWQNNHLGILKSVPAPWTPLALKDNTITCWGRSYQWNQHAFPSQILAQGEELLAHPIQLKAIVNQQRCELENVKMHWEKVTPLRAEFTAQGDLTGIPVTVKGWIEFDGFLWSEISIDRDDKAEISQLTMDIPLLPKASTLMQGRLPVPAGGKTVNFRGPLRFAPIIWLGNEHCGLQWSTEDIRDWKFKDENDMVRLTVKPTETALRLTFLDQSIRMTEPLKYTMGLQATPVKPWNENSHAWEMALIGNAKPVDDSNKTPRQGWAFYWQAWNRRDDQQNGPYGYQVASEKTGEDLAKYLLKNSIPWIYWHQHAFWLGDPTLRAYGYEWGGTYSENADATAYVSANRTIPSTIDYQIWLNWKLLKDNPELAKIIPGIYIDVAQASWNENKRPGASGIIFELLGTRDLQKRFFSMLRANWPALLISNHQSGDVEMSQLAFADMMVTGEHLGGDPRLTRDLSYKNILTLDGMRAEFTGRNFGIPMVFLPEIQHSVEGDPGAVAKVLGPEGIPAAEHLVGMLWVHDIIPWVTYVNPQPFLQAARVKQAFGWDKDTQFHGYWENSDLVKATSDIQPVVVSVFTRKGKALFVVMNNSDQDAKVELFPNWTNLGMKALPEVTDAYSSQTIPATGESAKIPVSDNAIQLTVKGRNFRVVEEDQL